MNDRAVGRWGSRNGLDASGWGRIAFLFLVGDGDEDNGIRGELRGRQVNYLICLEYYLLSGTIQGDTGSDRHRLGGAFYDLQPLRNAKSVQQTIQTAAHGEMVCLLVGEIRLDEKLMVEIMQSFDGHVCSPLR